jgi:hypothetical protein
LQDGIRYLSGKSVLRSVIEMALEEGQPRSQAKTGRRRGMAKARQFTLLPHHREHSYQDGSREAFWSCWPSVQSRIL